MTYLLLSFLAGVVVGGIAMYCKGKRDGLNHLSNEILDDVRRKEQRDGANRVRRAKNHLRKLSL
jgi:hypothetical protein